MRFPDDTQRIAIIGATGSGKTQSALWHLSNRNFHTMPWVVYNFKRDALIDGIPHARHMGLDEIPDAPGIYVVHPQPHQTAEVENHLWNIWDSENTGVYVDEGYMMGRNNPAFRAILTQGRAKNVPTMTLTQRPAFLDYFILSESEFFQVFRLQHKKDKVRVEEFSPIDMNQKLPEYYSHYYDVGANETVVLKPVPRIEEIHATFARRLGGKKQAV
jgi:hypothetical protein